MKKLTVIFSFLFFFLVGFALVVNQFSYHSLSSTTSKEKTSDQLAQEIWEYEKRDLSLNKTYRFPLKFSNFNNLKRLGINGINSKNNNLLETVKETAPFKIYARLSSAVRTELKNLVQIPNWAIRLRDLYAKIKLEWKKNFWDKIRKKYLTYLRRYEINWLKLKHYGVSSITSTDLLFKYNFDTPFENLSSSEKENALPDPDSNGWELSIRKKINTVSGDVLFLDAKAIWENTLRSTYLFDLKKYSLSEIGGVEIASLLKLTEDSEFVNFTFQQQDQIHNLVDLANYQTLLKALINQKRQEEKTATAFWNNASKREKIKQLLNYDLFTIGNVSLNQFTSDDFAKSFNDLTSQQQEQLKQLINLENYASKITLLLSEEKATEEFWANAINKELLANLFQSSITMLDEIKINHLNKDLLLSDYLALTSEQKEQVRSLSKLTNFSQAVQQAVVKAKEKTNQLPLILGLSLGLPSLLLLVIFSYLYWKKRKKKTSKNLHK